MKGQIIANSTVLDIVAPIIGGDGYLPYDDTFKQRIYNDRQLQRDEFELCKYNFAHLAHNWLYIIGMDGEKQLFHFNPVQWLYHKAQTRDDIILKSRKVGISTYKVLQGLQMTIFQPYIGANVLCHEINSTSQLFRIFTTAFDNLPDFLKPMVKKRTSEILEFAETPFGDELNSFYQIGTAGSVDFGRGGTLDFIHLSEYAHYPDPPKIKKGILQARRRDNRSVYSIESTANGLNDFQAEWDAAEDGSGKLKAHFFAWYQDPSCIEPIWPKMVEQMSREDKCYFEKLGCTLEQQAFYIDKRDRERLGIDGTHEQYPSLPSEAFVATSRGVFDQQLLARVEQDLLNRLEALKEKNVDHVAEKREDGAILLYKLPKPGWKYVIGADSSKGVVGGDFSCAIILDNHTGEQVGELHGRWQPEIFAGKLNEIGKEYNNALIAVEKDKYGTAVLERLVTQHDYPNLFYEWKYDKQNGGESRELGWTPTMKSKPQIIIVFQDALRQDAFIPNSKSLLRECKTYVHITTKRMGADEGQSDQGEVRRDDRVIAGALAVYAMSQSPWVPTGKEQPDDSSYRDRWFAYESKRLRERQTADVMASRIDREFLEYQAEEYLVGI